MQAQPSIHRLPGLRLAPLAARRCCHQTQGCLHYHYSRCHYLPPSCLPVIATTHQLTVVLRRPRLALVGPLAAISVPSRVRLAGYHHHHQGGRGWQALPSLPNSLPIARRCFILGTPTSRSIRVRQLGLGLGCSKADQRGSRLFDA